MSAYLLEILKCCLPPFINLSKRVWNITDITELIRFRKKTILAGDLRAKYPV
jgi:hypothetical protein